MYRGGERASRSGERDLSPLLLCCVILMWLRCELADERRPVAESGALTRPMRCSTTRTDQVVAAATDEERPAPVGVAASTGDVLAGDPRSEEHTSELQSHSDLV